MTMETAKGMPSLASRVHRGESAALEELLAELRPLIVQVARLVVGSGASFAEDAAQEALIDVSRGLRKLRDPAAVRTWALRIATRRALKVARRERLFRFGGSDDLPELQVEASIDGRQAALKQAFDLLTPRLRATAVLRLHAGLSEAETASALGCSVGTVKSNLHDARKQLTQSLIELGYTPTVQKGKENNYANA